MSDWAEEVPPMPNRPTGPYRGTRYPSTAVPSGYSPRAPHQRFREMRCRRRRRVRARQKGLAPLALRGRSFRTVMHRLRRLSSKAVFQGSSEALTSRANYLVSSDCSAALAMRIQEKTVPSGSPIASARALAVTPARLACSARRVWASAAARFASIVILSSAKSASCSGLGMRRLLDIESPSVKTLRVVVATAMSSWQARTADFTKGVSADICLDARSSTFGGNRMLSK